MLALTACRSKLKAFIVGRTPVRDDADDILQEVTWQLMKVEQPVENVAAWLFRAARNEMTDRARKKRELPLSDYYSDDDECFLPEDELALAFRHCYPASTRPCFIYEPVFAIFMMS